jgi:hypothetical protein
MTEVHSNKETRKLKTKTERGGRNEAKAGNVNVMCV